MVNAQDIADTLRLPTQKLMANVRRNITWTYPEQMRNGTLVGSCAGYRTAGTLIFPIYAPEFACKVVDAKIINALGSAQYDSTAFINAYAGTTVAQRALGGTPVTTRLRGSHPGFGCGTVSKRNVQLSPTLYPISADTMLYWIDKHAAGSMKMSPYGVRIQIE